MYLHFIIKACRDFLNSNQSHSINVCINKVFSPSELNVERVVEVIQISDSPIAHGNDNSFVLIKPTDGLHVVAGQTNEK